MKYWLLGSLAGVALFLALLVIIKGLIVLVILGLVIFLVSCMDWSGQGDGREGCNRHTVCRH